MARRPLLGVFIGALIGAFAGAYAVVSFWAVLACVALVTLLAAVRARRGVLIATWLAAAALVALGRAATGPPRAEVATCGIATGAAGYRESRWRVRIDGPREGSRVAAVLERERCDETWQPRGMRASLSLWDGPVVVRGDRLELTLAVEPIARARNRTEPDPRERAVLDGLDVSARVRSPHLVVEHGHGLLTLVDRARDAAGRALSQRLPRERAAVAKGLVMGDRSDLTPLERDAWADAGLAHLLAVSGMHVTMIVVVVLAVVKLGLGLIPGVAERVSLAAVAALAALPCAAWFCLWSASPSSALRATIMGSIGLAGMVLGHHGKALDALCFTGFVMLAVSPMSLHDPGFTLSMAAVASLLVLPRASARAGVRGWCKKQLETSLSASVAATLATLPITASAFGRVSLVAPLTNLVAVPLGATLATPLAIAVVMLAPVAPAAADLASRGLDVLLAMLLVIVKFGAALPGAALAVPRPNPLQLVAYGVVILALRSRAFVFAAGAGLVAIGAGITRHAPELAIEFPYVGQGDGIIIHAPSGETIVVDAGGAIIAGGSDPGRGVMAPLLRADGVRRIDLAVVTHPHPDHLGGFAYLAERFPIARLWSNGQDDDHPILKALRDNVRRSGGTVARPLDLPAVVHFGGLTIDVIHPRAPPESYLPELGLNDNSLVLRLTYGQRRILLTGDIEALAEREIVAASTPANGAGAPQPSVLDADILKVGHHGSRTSSSETFIDAVHPLVAIASCGVHNDFGFPHRETRERFASRGVPLLTTREHGAIRLRSDGSLWRIAVPAPLAYAKAAPVVAWEALDD